MTRKKKIVKLFIIYLQTDAKVRDQKVRLASLKCMGGILQLEAGQ